MCGANRPSRFGVFNVALLAICTLGASVPPMEKLLPDDTLAVVSAPDFSKFQRQIQHLPLRRLWDDPAMKPFRARFTTRWHDELVKPLERDLDLRFADFAGLPQGQVTLALTRDDWDGRSDTAPAFVLLLDAAQRSHQLRTNLAELRRKWISNGKTLRLETVRGVEFAVLTLTRNDVPPTLRRFLPPPPDALTPATEDAPPSASKTESRTELALGQWESLLIVSTSLRTAEKIVAHVTGGAAPALADVATFEASLAQLRDALACGWINVRLFTDHLNKLPSPKPAPNSTDPPAIEMKTLLAGTGLAGVRSLAFSHHDSGEGTLFQLTCAVPFAERAGFTKIFAPESRDAAPPLFVPADAVKFQRARLDAPKAWAAFEAMLDEISPAWARVLNDLVVQANKDGQTRDPGFDVRRDLIGNLGDDLLSWQKPPRRRALADLEAPPVIWLLGSPAAEKLGFALRGFLAVATPQAGPIRERDFLGRKIYSATPPLFGPPDDPKGTLPVLHFASSGSYVGFSRDALLLEEWLRSGDNPPKPLRDASGLVEAWQRAGGTGGGWASYENAGELVRAWFETFKQEAGAVTNASVSGPLSAPVNLATEGRGLAAWFDFALLPPWEAVARYFHFTVASGSANADGLTCRWFSPTPPELKN